LLVNYGKTMFSETFPELWLFLMGGLFIAVVMYFPNGLAGVWEKHGKRMVDYIKALQVVESFLTLVTNKLAVKSGSVSK